MILKRQFDQQTSVIITIYNCQEWRKLVLCWFNWQHEMKHEIHMIWTSDQMRRIQAKNMKIVHNNKKKHINFDKKVSWRSVYYNFLKNVVHMTQNWSMILNSISFWNKQSDRKHKHDYEAVSANILFISAKWLKEMILSHQIYHKQHNKWINKYDFILCNLWTKFTNWIWITNWNQWTWSHDKITTTDQHE